MSPRSLPFKISTLVFVRDVSGAFLLIERAKAPNHGCWSPIGGKLEMSLGESPYECARRETGEEIGLALSDADLHCFGYISEKHYEGGVHWLMFLFNCKKRIETVPPGIDEGKFGLFRRSEIEQLQLPETDRRLLWPYFDKYSNGFVGLRADCDPDSPLEPVVELSLLPPAQPH